MKCLTYNIFLVVHHILMKAIADDFVSTYFYGKQQPNSLVVHPDFILTTVFDIFAGMWKCSVKSGDIRVGIT